jgi:glycosyltransferase involved in cell wall biosynthesis/MoaA/NifB/PqqE/SkfB family radical SAM enzyme
MRVLMIHPHDIYSPLEPWTIRITALARSLTDLGHEIKVVYHIADPKQLPGDLRHRQEFPFEVIPMIRHMGLGLRKSREMSTLASWADIIHVQKCLSHAALPAAAAAMWHGVPLHYDWDDWEAAIYEESVGQDANWRRINRFERALPGIADTISVASLALREQALALGIAEERIFDAPVGADLHSFECGGDGSAIRDELGIKGQVTLYLGQLAGAHAAPLFLEAAALVAQEDTDATFLVVGGGRSLAELREQATRSGIAHRVHFTGAVPHHRVPEYLDLADVAVATLQDSPQAATKSPLKVVEYMAAGKAIVASRVGEAIRFLDDGRVGLLVEPGCAEAIAAKVLLLLGDEHRRSELGALARDHLRRNHTWMHSAASLEQAYQFARSRRGRSIQGRAPSRGLGPEGLHEPPGGQQLAVPQANVAPPPPPALTSAKVKELIKAPGQRLQSSLRGRLDLVGVFDGEHAYTGPSTIQLDVTNRCNNDCIACWLHSPLLAKTGPNAEDRRSQLRFDIVKQLIDDAAAMGTRDFYMAGGGDPIVYPWLRETLERIKGHGMAAAVNTNFSLVDEEWCRWACEIGLDDLTISVWGGTAEGFDATHPNKGPDDFERLIEMITYLNKTKREMGRGPTVKLYHVVSNLNAHEFGAMYQLAETTGSEAVEFTVVDTVPGHTDVLLFDDETRQTLLRQSLQLQERLARRGERDRLFGFEQWLRRLRCKDVVDGLGDANIVHTFPCTIGWTFLRVMPDGKVTSCLKSHRIPIGNVNEGRLPEMWNNAQQRKFRRMTNVYEKRDPWFSNIGNDPAAACGCEKSCDDLGRNLAMVRRVDGMSRAEQVLVQHASKVLPPPRGSGD